MDESAAGGESSDCLRMPSNNGKGKLCRAKKALKDRFKPDSRRELYLSEFSTKKRRPGEGWAEYADELRVLADKAFPELEEQVRERLALNQYLGQLDNPQVAFNVKRPASLIDTVSSTLEMESYLLPRPSKVATVDIETESVIAAVQSKQDLMMDMLQGMMKRLDRLESSQTNPIICHKCGQEGHFTRGLCQSYKPASSQHQTGHCCGGSSQSFYTVSGSTQGIPTTFIIDTGAAVTLLRKDMWDKLPQGGKLLTPWDGSPLVGVAGNPLEVWGSVIVEVEIAGETFRTRMVVASALTAEAILGVDFLESHNCTLEIGKRVLRFANRGVAIALQGSSPKPVIVQARVTWEETV